VVDDAGFEAEAAVDELGAVLVAAGGLEAVAVAGGLEALEADRELGGLGWSAGSGVTGLRVAANLARLAGARATRSSTAQLPSKRKHSIDDRTLRIAQSVVARPLEMQP
jgi:hypothetical protein